MRSNLSKLLVGLVILTITAIGVAQPPPNSPQPDRTEQVSEPVKELEARQTELATLRQKQDELKKGAADEDQKKQIELLQKQVETMEKMIKLLADQLKKQPAAGPAVEKLETQTATLEARSLQAARRDKDLANAVDDLHEHVDSQERNGPWLPAGLRQWFLPGGTNETPLSIYGQFVENYSQFNARPGIFSTPDFAPFFLLKLNDKFFLEATVDITNGSVAIGNAQMDWFINDWLTFVIGRYITPIGYFNERLNHEWINKLPDVPIMFYQVSPLSSTDGVQFRGSTYICDSPYKVEYSLYGGNGFQLPTTANTNVDPTVDPILATSDLSALAGSDETTSKAVGGRIGFLRPEWGVNVGFSGYFQNGYSPGDKDHIQLWGFDANFHKGNWDARFEFAQVYQQAADFIGNNIRRTGLYAQLAYRPYDCDHRFLRNLELVGMYSMARFKGIDPALIDVNAYGDPRNVPVNRDQWIFSLNYYLYPSMIFKFAYEINHEEMPLSPQDNVFLAQFSWAF